MKVAILYICTGRYTIFWDGFYTSSERHLLPGHEKHYFVFTDGQIPHMDNPRVHHVEQENLGWPGNTLKRFHMFSRIGVELAKFDYIFFFNANSEFCTTVGEEFLPSEKEGLLLTQHPGYFRTWCWRLPYDRNPASCAYIPLWRGRHYVCGGLNGGLATNYIQLINDLRQAVDRDESNAVVARWHDESHINRYALNRNYKLLHPGYMYPDNYNLPFPKIIRLLDKNAFGGHDNLRQNNV